MFKSHSAGVFVASLLLLQPCLGSEMAQEVIIPGYNPNSASQINKKAPTALPTHSPKSTDNLATPGDMDDLVESVNLEGWSNLSQYLWTCTPSNFNLPPADTKNKLRMEFDALVQKGKVPTLAKANAIASELMQLANYRVMGLYGSACQITMSFPKTKNTPPQNFNCFLTIRDARYLSQLSSTVAVKKGTTDLVPDETLAAMTDLLVANCHDKGTLAAPVTTSPPVQKMGY